MAAADQQSWYRLGQIGRHACQVNLDFPGAPLKVNGAPGNIQGNLTGMGKYFSSMGKDLHYLWHIRVNSLTTGRCNSIIKYVIFKDFVVSGIWNSLCEITFN